MTLSERIHPIHELLLPTVLAELSEEDIAFWESEGYAKEDLVGLKKIVFSTASARKMLMVNLGLHMTQGEEKFPFSLWDDSSSNNDMESTMRSKYREVFSSHPLALMDFFEKYIHNGDGAYTGEPLLLGKFHGIPVYGESTKGEEKDGVDPTQQALLKVQHIVDQNEHRGEKIIYVSGDSLEMVGEAQTPHQKPSGDFDLLYRKKKDGESEAEYEKNRQQAFERYMRNYVRKMYRGQHETTSTSGIAAIAVDENNLKAAFKTHVSYTARYKRLPKNLKPQSNASGGAVNQRIVFRNKRKNEFTDHPDGDIWQWIVLFQDSGAPVLTLMTAAVEAGRALIRARQQRD